MAGTIPFIPYVPQIDNVREIMPGCLLYIYEATTVNPAIAYKDISLTAGTEHPWPIPADSMGRIPMFWLPDGMYRVRLTNASGSFVAFDLPSVPALGASDSSGGGGGGGGGVSPDVIFQTGDPLWVPTTGTRSGWVRHNGRTIGNATSGATERASADTQALFEILYGRHSDSICPVLGGRGASATADFNAGKQLTLLDGRFITPVGLDDMGGSAAGRASGVPVVTGSGTTAGSTLGEAAHTLLRVELPAIRPSLTVTDPGHPHDYIGPNDPTVGANGGSIPVVASNTTRTTSSHTTGISVAFTDPLGSAQGHNITQLVMTGTWYVKL